MQQSHRPRHQRPDAPLAEVQVAEEKHLLEPGGMRIAPERKTGLTLRGARPEDSVSGDDGATNPRTSECPDLFFDRGCPSGRRQTAGGIGLADVWNS